MYWIIFILGGIILIFGLLKSSSKRAVDRFNWQTPVLLGTNIQDGSIFRQIIIDDMNKEIANGATVIREGREIPESIRIAGRNHIYLRASPHYQVGEVYSTIAQISHDQSFIVYIWIDKGWTHDAPYEIRY
jgi:hypothetical protein